MSLVYAEFPSDLPPSMSDEELEQLKKQYRENHRSKRESRPEVERVSEDNLVEGERTGKENEDYESSKTENVGTASQQKISHSTINTLFFLVVQTSQRIYKLFVTDATQ